MIGRVEAGTLLRNLGCREGGGRDWCNIEYVDASGTQGWAAAEYLEPASASIRAGQGIYDQIGRLGCVDVAGGAATECEYGVARDRDGTAVVTVFRGDRTQLTDQRCEDNRRRRLFRRHRLSFQRQRHSEGHAWESPA